MLIRKHLPRKKDDEIWIAYCGTLGKSYDIKCVIDALDKIQNPKLKLIVMGDEPQREEFEQYAIEKISSGNILREATL